MVIKKVQIRPPGYTDVVHPETSGDMVQMDSGNDLQTEFAAHKADMAKKLTWVSVKMFGAKGDGVTDDTTAILAAIAYLYSIGGGVLYFPNGIYLISDTLYIRQSKISVIGESKSASIIKLSPSIKISESESKWAIETVNDTIKTTQSVLTNGLYAGYLAKKRDIWLGVEDASLFNVGDLVYIRGDFSTSPWTCNDGDIVKGETNYVIDTNTTTNQIRLFKALSDTWADTEIVTINGITPLTNIEIKDISIVGANDRNYRGIRLGNCVMGEVKNVYVENTGIMAIESFASFKNRLINNDVVNAWAGDVKVSDKAPNGLGYGLRATNDTMTKISMNRINNARHCVDISGGYPSRMIEVTDNVGSLLKDEYGTFSTHVAAESCVFRGNMANGGNYGFMIRGENIIVENNITKNVGNSLYQLGRNIIIQNNDFGSHMILIAPEINDATTYTIIKNNVFRNTIRFVYLSATSDRPFDKAYNFVVQDNILYSTITSIPAFFTVDYAGSDTITFEKGLVFKNNIAYLSTGGQISPKFSSDDTKIVLERWSQIVTDSLCVVNKPTYGVIGQMVFLKDAKKPIWWDGTQWVYADGTIVT